MNKLLTIADAARRLNIHVDTLKRYEIRGLITPEYTQGGHRRYKELDIIALLGKKDDSMNYFYDVYSDHSNKKYKEIDLFVGDEKITSKIGCFEVLLVMDQNNEFKKIECTFLLGIPKPLDIPHAAVVSAILPSDILEKTDSYLYNMLLTTSEDILELSRLTKHFKGIAGPAVKIVPDFSAEIAEMRAEAQYLRRTTINCGDVYQTFRLENISKLKCKNFSVFPNTLAFAEKGMIFNFVASKLEGQ